MPLNNDWIFYRLLFLWILLNWCLVINNTYADCVFPICNKTINTIRMELNGPVLKYAWSRVPWRQFNLYSFVYLYNTWCYCCVEKLLLLHISWHMMHGAPYIITLYIHMYIYIHNAYFSIPWICAIWHNFTEIMFV